MNRRILIIISCALVLSVCASYLVYRAIGDKGTTAKNLKSIPVVVAARDLDAGSLIHDTDVKTTAWVGPVPKGAAAKTDNILNRGVTSPIYEGEPITETRLAHQGSGGGLAGTIPTGMRACAVKVNEVVGVAGFVVPGMRVDVLVTGLPPGGNPLDGSRVRTLLQNIQVLSAGMDFQRDQAGKPQPAQVVNLLVTPADAEVLSLASNEMHIQLVLRNPMDTTIVRAPGTVVSDLFGGVRASNPPVPPAPPASRTKETVEPQGRPTVVPVVAAPTPAKPYVVEIVNGAVHTETKFSSPEVHE
jgi:pilus assembly protein CpaB